MAGLGIVEYFSEGFNIFDFFVVAISMVELGVMMKSGAGDGNSLSALRSFKTLRIMKSFRVLRMLRMFRCDAHFFCKPTDNDKMHPI